MLRHRQVPNPIQKALSGNPQQTAPSTGYQRTVEKKPDNTKQLITGLGMVNAMGEGNAVTGAAAHAMGGPTMATGGALGFEHGQKADNPWEAFIAGGTGATQNVYSDPKLIAMTPNPLDNAVAGGLSGVAGFIGIPGVSALF